MSGTAFSRSTRRALGAVVAVLALTGAGAVFAPSVSAQPQHDKVTHAPRGAHAQPAFNRFVVHYLSATSVSDAEVAADAAAADATVSHRTSTGAAVVQVADQLNADQADAVMAKLAGHAKVISVEPDLMLQAVFAPNDPRYNEQWDMYETTGGIRLPAALDTATKDGEGAVVGVIDTGITDHPDLDANVIAGYDFISDAATANDGGGRDNNPHDPGDWYGVFECISDPFGSRNSSWHGSHVSGTIAAVTNNGTGVVGIAPKAKIQPVRVLGECGGSISDIADAIVWASGGSMSGVPANPTPADVVSLSLGGGGSCGTAMQNAINGARSRGTVVVVAAGNESSDASGSTPANCNGVITVASTNRQGARAWYSNFGSTVEIAAPGGETRDGQSTGPQDGILSTLNSGTTTPVSPSYAFYQGTSMATPHVSGVVALLAAENQSLTPDQILSKLQSTGRPFPGSCSGCGAGILDAGAALGGTEPPPPPPPSGGTFTNDTDVAIPETGTITSSITVPLTGAGPTNLQVKVDIAHTYRGDLVIDLLAPDGTAYRLKNSNGSDSADNVIATYTVNVSSEQRNGTWKLRVQDVYAGDSGTLRSWSLIFP